MTTETSKRIRPVQVFFVFALGACGDSASPPSEDINAFAAGLPSWDAFSPPLPDSEYILESGGDETDEVVEGTMYKCRSTPYSLTKTPDKVVTLDPDVNVLWLGALLQGDGYKEGIGSLAEWSVRERAPIDITIDLLAAQSSKRVEKPTLASVNQAVGELVQAATAAGHRGGSSVSYANQNTHTVFQAALKLGVSRKWIGSGAALSLTASHTADKRTVTAYFVQRMFTASFVLPNRPSDMFSPAFTSARLQQEIESGNVGTSNPPVYVASIVYGRILMFTFTSTARADSIRLALNRAFKADTIASGGDSLDAKVAFILQSADIRVVTVGGEGRNALALIRSGDIASYFNEDAALTSARPISYTVRNLGDNSIARVSETTEYNLKECDAVPTTGRMHIDVTPNDARVAISGPAGYTFTQTGDQMLTELTPGGYSVVVSRQGFDTARIETSVNAGDVTEVPVTLRDPNQSITGGIYSVYVNRIIFDAVGCAETLPDVYHDIRVAGRILTLRARNNYVELSAGSSDYEDLVPKADQWNTVTDTVFFSNKAGTTTDTVMTLRADIKDNDDLGDDVMAGATRNFYKSTVPTGLLTREIGTTGCGIRLEFTITRTGSMFN